MFRKKNDDSNESTPIRRKVKLVYPVNLEELLAKEGIKFDKRFFDKNPRAADVLGKVFKVNVNSKPFIEATINAAKKLKADEFDDACSIIDHMIGNKRSEIYITRKIATAIMETALAKHLNVALVDRYLRCFRPTDGWIDKQNHLLFQECRQREELAIKFIRHSCHFGILIRHFAMADVSKQWLFPLVRDTQEPEKLKAFEKVFARTKPANKPDSRINSDFYILRLWLSEFSIKHIIRYINLDKCPEVINAFIDLFEELGEKLGVTRDLLAPALCTLFKTDPLNMRGSEFHHFIFINPYYGQALDYCEELKAFDQALQAQFKLPAFTQQDLYNSYDLCFAILQLKDIKEAYCRKNNGAISRELAFEHLSMLLNSNRMLESRTRPDNLPNVLGPERLLTLDEALENIRTRHDLTPEETKRRDLNVLK